MTIFGDLWGINGLKYFPQKYKGATSGEAPQRIKMLWYLAALCVLSLSVSARPTEHTDRGIAIPLSKRSSLAVDGVVDIEKLRSHVLSIQS
jgi:hypothetical protein